MWRLTGQVALSLSPAGSSARRLGFAGGVGGLTGQVAGLAERGHCLSSGPLQPGRVESPAYSAE
eukprot:4128267-Pyramimonas_sp.AAC.1